MKLVLIPPYSNPNVTEPAWERELVAKMEERGQLEGLEVDVAEGHPTDYSGEGRDAEFTAIISPGAIKRVREYSEMGKHDAIVVGGSLEPGFFAARMVSKIPVVYTLHSAVIIASLIGERFAVIDITDDECYVVRHCVESHGLSHKLASVRAMGHTSTYVFRFTQKYKRGERGKVPEGKKIIDDITNQCIAAIEKDLVDSLVFECPAVQLFDDEVRQRLDELGYGEIQIISSWPAGVEMARAMVNLKLIQAPRAYPSIALKAKPEFR